MSLTLPELRASMPNAPLQRLNAYLGPLGEAMDEFEVNTPEREAAFVAQIAHESGELRYLVELWGPTAAQSSYDGRMGNDEPGDGYRYRGRGVIQLTGKDNYRVAGKALGLDLEGNPDLAAQPETAFRVAGWYWATRNCNPLADAGDFDHITRRINGGLNGLASRRRYWDLAKKALGVT